jgi:CubicO group peptidase (beta-lactamase class C family)
MSASQVNPRLVRTFLRDYQIPGLSLAVAQQDQVVYASGFGVADKTTGEAVQASSRFRIASLTKPITATAVFGLVARNALTLDDRVFGPSAHLSALTGTPADRRVRLITVRHLLQHGCGGWSNDVPDPMYTYPELSARDLITKVLATRRLDNDPGTNYAYSNFGYCVLGRVIEAVTGETYENWVRENVLVRCGSSMTIAGNTLADRQPGEVVYYGLDGDDPYGIPVSRMDSHGGWVATATDCLRFLVRVDGLPPDLLRPGGITQMTTPSGLPNSNGYASGWSTKTDGTWWHVGILPGTRSIMVRTADGFCWAALANSGRTVENDTTRDTLAGLDALMWTIHDQWPYSDQL